MEFKKIMSILIVLVMVGALVGLQSASAATSRVAIYNERLSEVYSFSSVTNDEYLQMVARLYVDGEWKSMRNLDFEVYDPRGASLFSVKRQTSFITGYASIAIWNRDLVEMESGDYTLKVSYSGNEGKGWPAATATAVIHHTNLIHHKKTR